MIRSTFKRPERPAHVRTPAVPIPLDQRRGVIARCDGMAVAVAKAPAPVRDEEYRRLVAQLPCFQCRIEGASQAAHPNTDKARGRKTSDHLVFPLCHEGAKGHHAAFDQYRLVPKADMPDFERRAYHWTVRELLARGLWPSRLPIPDTRSFH